MIEIQIRKGLAKNGFQQVGSFAIRVSLVDEEENYVRERKKAAVKLSGIQMPDMREKVLRALSMKRYRYDSQSPDWYGHAIMDVCDVNEQNGGRTYARNFMAELIKEGCIELFQSRNEHRVAKTYVRVVPEPAALCD